MIYFFFPSSYTPTNVGGAANYNLGGTFTSTVAGTVTGLKFWKSTTDTGTHVGTLWQEGVTGSPLGSVTFTGETASGWQTATFASPIPIVAGTRYRTAVSHAADFAAIASAPSFGSGPLILDAGGVYVATLSGYPATTHPNNFLVDVIADLTVPSTVSFWDPSYTPPSTASTNVPANLAVAFSSAFSGVVNAIRFWKVATDTGTHVVTLYRESDQALLAGPLTVTGETASGWQTATFGTPAAIVAGVRYRACVTHSVQWAAFGSGSIGSFLYALQAGPLTMDTTDYYRLDATSGYPGSSNANHNFLVDVLTTPSVVPTQAWASQVQAEAWVLGPGGRVVMSQAVAEAWIRQIPLTAAIVSQAVAEVWQQVPHAQPLRVSSQLL